MRKRILFIIPSLEIGGGAEKVASSLTFELSKIYDVFIITFYKCKNHYKYTGLCFSLNQTIFSGKKFLRPLFLYKYIKKITPDLIISFMDHTNIISIIFKILFKIKIPLILTIHANPKEQYKGNLHYLNYAIKFFYRLKAVNKIVTVSKDIQIIMQKFYGINKKKIMTIYNGIELEKIRVLSQEKVLEYQDLFYNENLIKFITVGRLIELKGHKFLINAFSKVKCEIKNSKLIIIGEGPLKNNLKKQISTKNLNEDIILLGLRKNPFKFMKKSTVFVLSSLKEALPTVLLEALACGLPIISTNCRTGPKEILDKGKYGLLANIKDEEDLAKKMIFLAKNTKLLNYYSKKSYERANAFDIYKIKNVWLNLLKDFLN